MPLASRITDASTGEARAMRWGWWHIEMMTVAARAHFPETEDMALLTVWSQPETSNGFLIEFPMGFKDPTDGEVFILNASDHLHLWRE